MRSSNLPCKFVRLPCRKLAEYELDPILDQRVRQLGEQKELLSQAEHEELLALVQLCAKAHD